MRRARLEVATRVKATHLLTGRFKIRVKAKGGRYIGSVIERIKRGVGCESHVHIKMQHVFAQLDCSRCFSTFF